VDALIPLLVLIVLVVGGFVLFTRLRGSPEGARAQQVWRSRREGAEAPKLREPTVQTVEPGDAIAFGDGDNAVVVSVLECREVVGPRTSTWRWSFLDDGKLLEAAPDDNVLYTESSVAYQGEAAFQQFVAEPEQGGVLKTFEQRVRSGTSASEPVTFEHAGRTFHLRSTGTFSGRARGKPLGEVWTDMSPNAGDNVYFEAEAQTGEQLLGVWTSHIALLIGRKLGLTDIDAIYPGTGGEA
jgi:hypothetical protein